MTLIYMVLENTMKPSKNAFPSDNNWTVVKNRNTQEHRPPSEIRFSSPYESKFPKLLLDAYAVRALGNGTSSSSSISELTSEPSVPLPDFSVLPFRDAA